MAMDIGTLVGYLELDTSKFEEGAKGAGAKMPGWMAAAGATAALAVGAAFSAAFVNAVNIDAGNDKIASQLGLTEAESKRAGQVAAEAYVAGFGESVPQMQATTAGVISSIRGMRDASVEELGGIVRGVQALSDNFEVEADRISQVVGQMLSTGLASSADEGLDLLTASLQKVPAAVREDLIDAVDEYGPFFAQVGLSGEDAMSALVAASEKGMYGIDKTGDALKEFTLKATDMSKSSVAAYDTLGLSADDMAASLLAGGDQGAEAFQRIVDGLLGIEDPVAQSQAALALFGTPLEDLGTNEIPAFLQGLSDMEGGLGDWQGSTEEMAATASGNVAASWEQVTRSLEYLMTTVAGGLLPVLEPLAAWLAENPTLVGAVALGLGVLAAALGIAAVAQWAMNSALLASPITWIILGIAAVIAALVLLIANWDAVVAWVSDVWDGFIGWVTGVLEGFAGWWNETWAAIGEWITSVWEGFIGWITDTWSGFVSWLMSIVNGVRSWWNGLWSGIGSFFEDVWNGIVAWAVSIITSFIARWTVIWSRLTSFFSGLWDSIGDAISSAWEGILSFFEGIPDAIKGFFTGVGTWLYSIGRDLINGLLNGIQSLASTIGSFFLNLLPDWIREPFKIALGIHSPSREFFGYGMNIGEGLVEGLDAYQPVLEARMSSLVPVPDYVPDEWSSRYGSGASVGAFHYHAAEGQSLSSEEALFLALGSPRSPFGGMSD
ncbi:phage tail tape measure protein [Microbacterium sp.]|uniref:phage tail tape measure protein n=1 Tax=Microbacterium sp. TaxID=51671 RepID=UPI0039E48C88